MSRDELAFRQGKLNFLTFANIIILYLCFYPVYVRKQERTHNKSFRHGKKVI